MKFCATFYVNKGFRFEPKSGALWEGGDGAFIEEIRSG
jgi:hypothetical protein